MNALAGVFDVGLPKPRQTSRRQPARYESAAVERLFRELREQVIRPPLAARSSKEFMTLVRLSLPMFASKLALISKERGGTQRGTEVDDRWLVNEAAKLGPEWGLAVEVAVNHFNLADSLAQEMFPAIARPDRADPEQRAALLFAANMHLWVLWALFSLTDLFDDPQLAEAGPGRNIRAILARFSRGAYRRLLSLEFRGSQDEVHDKIALTEGGAEKLLGAMEDETPLPASILKHLGGL